MNQGYYDGNQNDYEEVNNDKRKGNGSGIDITKIILIAVLFVLVVILLLKFMNGNNSGSNVNSNNDVTINIKNSTLNIKVGQSEYIEYTMSDSSVKPSFDTLDSSIATVDNNGRVIGIAKGQTEIKITYKNNGKTEEKRCTIIVTEDEKINNDPPVLDISLNNYQDGEWSKNDVVISVVASSSSGDVNVQYSINCIGSNCSYMNVYNNMITINNSGVNKVLVVATDNSNKQTTSKEVTIKIDKNAPKLSLSPDKTEFVSTTDIEICATCDDSDSGCKESRVCKTYTESQTNQTLSIEDNAGNVTKSDSFNVVIDKEPPKCKLTLSGNVIKASFSDNVVKYGFEEDFIGGNTNNMEINISGSRPGDANSKTYIFYVKNNVGSVGQCHIKITKVCTCQYCYPPSGIGVGKCRENEGKCYGERTSRWKVSREECVSSYEAPTDNSVSSPYYSRVVSDQSCSNGWKKITYQNQCVNEFPEASNYCYAGEGAGDCYYQVDSN